MKGKAAAPEDEGGDMNVAPLGALYPMRLVARMSGLNPATIRAWERRYQAIEPTRSSGNTRMFSASDVRRLCLLQDAVSQGHAIGAMAKLSDAELELLVDRSADTDAAPVDEGSSNIVDAYLTAVTRFDIRRSQEILLRGATLMPTRAFVLEVVVPILNEVGERWSHADIGVAHEHLVSTQLHGVLGTLLRMIPTVRGGRRVLVATPPEHRHEFGVLVGALLAARHGFEVVYLGVDLPTEEMAWAADISGASVILLGVTRDLKQSEESIIADGLEALAEKFDVWIGCPKHHLVVDLVPSARFFHNFENLDLALMKLATEAV
jgi:DNA-binding transcriptional MerR regulator